MPSIECLPFVLSCHFWLVPCFGFMCNQQQCSALLCITYFWSILQSLGCLTVHSLNNISKDSSVRPQPNLLQICFFPWHLLIEYQPHWSWASDVMMSVANSSTWSIWEVQILLPVGKFNLLTISASSQSCLGATLIPCLSLTAWKSQHALLSRCERIWCYN